MQERTAKLLKMAAGDLCLECRLYERYSGRGMYHSSTTGIVIESLQELPAIAAQAVLCLSFQKEDCQEDSEELIQDLLELRTDSLGRDYIVY